MWTNEERQQILLKLKAQRWTCPRCQCEMTWCDGLTTHWMSFAEPDVRKLVVTTWWECPRCQRRMQVFEPHMVRPWDEEKNRARVRKVSPDTDQHELPFVD